MLLTRRNVGQVQDTEERHRRGSTIWEDEADEYWKKMEPTQRCWRIHNYLRKLVLAVLLGGGVLYSAQIALDIDSIAAIKAKFAFPIATVTMVNGTEVTVPVILSTTSAEAVQETSTDPAFFRERCRVQGVQSRWHEDTCRKLCVRDPYDSACMNGCSYGSLTVTKLVCDKIEAVDISPTSRCPDGVSCLEACRAYDDEKPFPDVRNSCVRGCSNIVPSACARSLQIYRDLAQGALQ